jgi:DNA-binding MarR family transcriptional regulator
MSMEAMTWAIEVRGIKSPQKLVLLLLANRHNNDTGMCYPSIPRICAESGMHRATVIRAINALDKAGLLTIEKTFGKVNHYRLNTSVTERPVAESDPSHKVTTPVAESDYTRRTVRPEPKRTQTNPKGKFKPPTVSEVAAYCSERNNGINAQKFIDHYEANGWMRGKNKIKCWKACVRTWESRDAESKPKSQWRGGI